MSISQAELSQAPLALRLCPDLNPGSLEKHASSEISAKLSYIFSCMFNNTFKIKCTVSGHIVLSKTNECEPGYVLLSWLLYVLHSSDIFFQM